MESILKIQYSPNFVKEYRHLPLRIQELAEMRETIFRINPHDPRLNTHKLHGELKHCWAFSINHEYRIVFSYLDKQTIRFHAIGTHSIYH